MTIHSISVNTISMEQKKDDAMPGYVARKPATFEEAVTETGFGKFNVILLIVVIPAVLASIFETTTMSYVFSAAQCDLNLSLEDKGVLNAITYLGMISSALIWGFLFDTLGRRKLLVVGYLANSVFVFMSAFSQSVLLLMVSKFFGGLIINGPFAAMSSYLPEFHAAKYRPRIQLFIGALNSFGMIIIPLLAWFVLPQDWEVSLLDGAFRLHSWNFFLFICGLPSFFSGLMFLFLPESPKFLMSCGQNEKALEVFRKVYRLNSGKPADTYPVKELVDETKQNVNDKYGGQITANRSKIQALKEGFQQIRPLFYPPHITKMIHVCSILFMILMGLNTLRLWMPQIFQAVSDYTHLHNGTTANLCTMIELLSPSNTSIEECVVNNDNSFVYINSMIIASTSMTGYLVAGSLINFVGKKKLFVTLSLLGGLAAFCIYLANGTATTVALSSIFLAMTTIASNILLAIIVDVFPTTLRTLAISIGMMIGRIGAMIGNFIVPFLLREGCAPPFFLVGGLLIGSSMLSLLLPNSEMNPMQ